MAVAGGAGNCANAGRRVWWLVADISDLLPKLAEAISTLRQQRKLSSEWWAAVDRKLQKHLFNEIADVSPSRNFLRASYRDQTAGQKAQRSRRRHRADMK